VKGFSALELVITLVIAGILAALAIPYFTQSETDAAWFSDQVKAVLRYGQRQAVANRRPVYVFVTPTQVRLCYDDPCTNELAHQRLTAPSGVAIGTTATFSFNGLGRPDFGSTLNFTVGSRVVTVHAETGYVP
jgi:MSHA pilin protein MshC